MVQVAGNVGLGVGSGTERRKIAAGAELDFLTRGELHGELEPVLALLRRLLVPDKPTIQEISATGQANAAGAVTIDLGAPSASHSWDVHRVTVTGADPTITVVCAVRLYRVEASNPLRLVDIGTQVPSAATYSREQFFLKPEEHAIMVVTGFTASGLVIVNLSAEDTVWTKPPGDHAL